MADLVLVHSPKFSDGYPLLGRLISVLTMPAGLLGLAEVAERAGLRPLVTHLGAEKIADPAFSLRALLEAERPHLVGIALHFHPQSADAVKALRTARAALPDAFIFLGGLTASFFAEEILRCFPEADAVLRGEAEEGLKRLCEAAPARGAALPGVPGLSWRSGGSVVHNPASPAASAGLPSRARLDLMRHGGIYARLAQHLYFYKPSWDLETNLKRLGRSVGFPLPLVRGCAYSCEYCGGGRGAQRRLCGRGDLGVLPPEKAAAEMRALRDQGVDYVFFEYVPLGDGDSYYTDLLGRVRGAGGPELNVQCRALPSEAFLLAFAACAGGRSRLVFSPDAADDGARARAGRWPGASYAEFMAVLGRLEELGVGSEIFFSVGAGRDGAAELAAEIARLRRAYRRVRSVQVNAIELDPASPLYFAGQAPPAFADYAAGHAGGTAAVPATGREALCGEFCGLALQHNWRLPPPLRPLAAAAARLACRAAEACWREGGDLFPY